MMCFSEKQPGTWGPRRVTQAEIRSTFQDGWRTNYIQPSSFDINEGHAEAWLASLTFGSSPPSISPSPLALREGQAGSVLQIHWG